MYLPQEKYRTLLFVQLPLYFSKVPCGTRYELITKQYQPQVQVHVTMEAPDGERLALTFQGESARTFVRDDVLVLDRKPGVPSDSSEQAMGAYFIPRPRAVIGTIAFIDRVA